ncbi:MAG: murein L,D-transpeptidase catalytic domain family protein [Bacteriovorax sp.]|nr:murein L,D-transpeptidase catalytic domain family protein [Bacteriovorax sp.]
MTNKKLTIGLIVLSFFSQAIIAFEKDDMIELSSAVNARGSLDFRRQTDNIKKILPKGTLGKIQKKIKLPTGNYGIKIAVANGKNKDQSFWIYYNTQKPLMKLSKATNAVADDFENTATSSATIEEAKSAKLTEDQKTIVANPEEDIVESFIDLQSIKKDIDHSTSPVTSGKNCSDSAQKIKQQSEPSKASSPREILMSNYTKLGGDPTALRQALCFFDKNKNATFQAKGDPGKSNGLTIGNEHFITINDQNKEDTTNRLFILNLETNEVTSYFTGHGEGDKKAIRAYSPFNPGHFKFNPFVKTDQFSNANESYLTPRGFFITGNRESRQPTKGKTWRYRMRLYGLQAGINDNSFRREIHMHPYDTTSNQMLSSNTNDSPMTVFEAQPLTEGCTGLPPVYAGKIIDQIKGQGPKGGSLYYTYTPTEKEAGDDYCGDIGLLYKKK